MTNHPFPTTIRTIETWGKYPLIMGASVNRGATTIVNATGQPSSKAGAEGISQQFIDRGVTREMSLSRHTVAQGAAGEWLFAWTLTFYVHPGMRREIPVDPQFLPMLVDYLHALAVGIAPMDDLSRRIDAWVQFHTYGFGGMFDTSAEVVKFLKETHFPWSTVEKNVHAYGIETHDRTGA